MPSLKEMEFNEFNFGFNDSSVGCIIKDGLACLEFYTSLDLILN